MTAPDDLVVAGAKLVKVSDGWRVVIFRDGTPWMVSDPSPDREGALRYLEQAKEVMEKYKHSDMN